jgi:spore germination protein YaaH
VPSLLVVPANIADGREVRKLPIMYAPPIPVRTRRVYHTVRSGDTLYSVSRRYGVAVEDLQRWNGTDRIRPGQKLAVEVRAPTRRTAHKKPAKGKPKAEPKGKVYKKADR